MASRRASRAPRPSCANGRADARARSDGAAARRDVPRARRGAIRARIVRVVARGALLALVTLGCKRATPAAPSAPPLTTLGAITVHDLTPREDAPAHLDAAALGAALRARLLATGQFEREVPDAGDAARAITRVELQLGLDGAEVADKGLARTHVLVRLATRPSDVPGAIADELEGQGEQTYATPHADKSAIFAALVARVTGDLLDAFTTRRRLRQGSAEALHAAMLADGGDLRLEAIALVGERHLTAEAPALLGLLDDPDEPTRDAALGALIALGDRRAVTALTRSRSLRDRREMGKIIEAISILGGEEADDYLGFIASSHDDEEIRAEAKSARERLHRRGDASPNPL
jgi:hypothetical protein